MQYTSLSRILSLLLFLGLMLGVMSCNSGSVVDDSTSEAARTYRLPAKPPGPLDGSASSYPIQMMNGNTTTVPQMTGNRKVVLLNFWATWCGPCRREIPDLTALKKQFEGKDVEIIGLTVEEPEKRSVVQAFAQQFSINYTLGFSPIKVFESFNRANGSDPRAPIPQTFIFDRNGIIIDSVKGFRRDFRAWAEGAIGYALKNS